MNSTSTKNIDELIEIIKQDFKSLNLGIQNNIKHLEIYISSKTKLRTEIIEFDFDYFIELINEYCYKDVPSNSINQKEYVPPNRLELFKSIFLSEVKSLENKFITWYKTPYRFNSIENLYNKLFYSIYLKSLNTKKSVSEIFKDYLWQWKNTLHNCKVPIVFEIDLPYVFIKNDSIKLNNDFEIKNLAGYSSIKKEHYTGNFYDGAILFYNTEISIIHNLFENSFDPAQFDMFPSKDLQPEWNEKISSIYKVIFCIYLVGTKFDFKGYELFFPWWMEPTRREYREPRNIFKEQKLSISQVEELKKLLQLIENLDIFGEKELLLGQHRYLRLFERRNLSDALLDEFIILESIFTKGSTSEVSFRLSLNAALFLAHNFKEFKEIFEFLNTFYIIRSKIAHGELWTNLLKKKKYVKYLTNETNKIDIAKIGKKLFDIIKNYIDDAFKKIIHLKADLMKKGEDINVLEKFRKTYFLETSDITKKI